VSALWNELHLKNQSIVFCVEGIAWVAVSKQLPPEAGEYLICFQRNDCDAKAVTVGEYVEYVDEGEQPWEVDGGLLCFGTVLYWAMLPTGPR
jgi:hypothetical protein